MGHSDRGPLDMATHTYTPHNAPTASLVREVDLLRLQLAPPYVLLCAYTFTQRTP